ncbi:MAG: hypothetical protein H0Z38_00705 [Firmicutes bacterium]|nr:hypothetical protein [Bacillota bacterium]
MKKKILSAALSVLLGLGSAGVGLALDPGEVRLVDSIVQEYGLTEEEILSWVELGYGYGEITIAASLADAAGLPLSEVFAKADSGLGWGEIAALLGIDQTQFGQNVRQLFAQGAQKTRNTDLDWEAALVREMVQTRLRVEAQLQQPDSAATNQKQKEIEKTIQTEAHQKGQAAAGGSKGKAS